MNEYDDKTLLRDQLDIELSKYNALVANRVSQNELIWSAIPADFTAQAFLYMIILDNGSNFSLWAKAVAAFLSSMIGVLTIQLFERHRTIELQDSIQLEDLEKDMNKKYGLEMMIHTQAKNRTLIDKDEGENVDEAVYEEKKGLFGGIESTTCWKYGLWMFSGISMFICINSIALIWNNSESGNDKFMLIQLAFALIFAIMIIAYSVLGKDYGKAMTKTILNKPFVYKSYRCLWMVIALALCEVALLMFRFFIKL